MSLFRHCITSGQSRDWYTVHTNEKWPESFNLSIKLDKKAEGRKIQAEISNQWQASISINFPTENNHKQDKTYIFENKEVCREDDNPEGEKKAQNILKNVSLLLKAPQRNQSSGRNHGGRLPSEGQPPGAGQAQSQSQQLSKN